MIPEKSRGGRLVSNQKGGPETVWLEIRNLERSPGFTPKHQPTHKKKKKQKGKKLRHGKG